VEGRPSCSQCGREAPAEPEEARRWRHGELILAGEVDEVTAGLLLCPECQEEDREGAYEEGEGD
jgi:hypothetical protein